MYSAATQRALARLLATYGIHFGSLIWPLHTMQVQQLLWARYPDLCDLQYSCWQVGRDEATCSRCEQCLRIAVTALAGGDDPERMGIDLRKVLAFAASWEALANSPSAAPPTLPQDRAARELELVVMDTIRRITVPMWRLCSRAAASAACCPRHARDAASVSTACAAARAVPRSVRGRASGRHSSTGSIPSFVLRWSRSTRVTFRVSRAVTISTCSNAARADASSRVIIGLAPCKSARDRSETNGAGSRS